MTKDAVDFSQDEQISSNCICMIVLYTLYPNLIFHLEKQAYLWLIFFLPLSYPISKT